LHISTGAFGLLIVVKYLEPNGYILFVFFKVFDGFGSASLYISVPIRNNGWNLVEVVGNSIDQ